MHDGDPEQIKVTYGTRQPGGGDAPAPPRPSLTSHARLQPLSLLLLRAERPRRRERQESALLSAALPQIPPLGSAPWGLTPPLQRPLAWEGSALFELSSPRRPVQRRSGQSPPVPTSAHRGVTSRPPGGGGCHPGGGTALRVSRAHGSRLAACGTLCQATAERNPCKPAPALVAQWIEHRFPKPGVAGSIPAGGTNRHRVDGEAGHAWHDQGAGRSCMYRRRQAPGPPARSRATMGGAGPPPVSRQDPRPFAPWRPA